MLKKIILFFVCSFTIVFFSNAQSGGGAIQGKIIDKQTKESIPFANIVVLMGGSQKSGAAADFDGNFKISPLQPGKYDVEASYIGYANKRLTGIVVSSEKTTFITLDLQPTEQKLEEVEIVDYVVPLIKKDETSTGSVMLSEDIKELPTRDVNAIISTAGGTFSGDEGDNISIKGARVEGTSYYIDGIKVSSIRSAGDNGISNSANTATLKLPSASINQLTVITGGIPAAYGDVTGGVVSITTKGAASSFSSGLEAETSNPFDDYDNNLIGLNTSGPLWKKQDRTILGFFAAGEYFNVKDSDPSAVPVPEIKADKLNFIKANPIVKDADGKSYHFSAEDITSSDITSVKRKPNENEKGYQLNGKLDFQPSLNSLFSFGTTYNKGTYHDRAYYDRSLYNSLLNSDNNREIIKTTNRFYGRYTQNFKSDSSSTIHNAYYTLQYDYTLNKDIYQDDSHEDRIWDYGYVGKFEQKTGPSYQPKGRGYILDPKHNHKNHIGNDTLWISNGYWHVSDTISSYVFTPGDKNPQIANYTESYETLTGGFPLSQIGGNSFLIKNGSRPGNVYSLYANVGRTYPYFLKSKIEQHRYTASGGFDFKNHGITFGTEYEQRISKQWRVNAGGDASGNDLWSLARQQTKRLGSPGVSVYGEIPKNQVWPKDTTRDYIGFKETGDYKFELDTIKGFVYVKGVLAPDSLSNFETNLRKNLGMSNVGLVNIDELRPDQMDINYFSPDELLDNGNSALRYFGYDVYGNELNENVGFKDFFEAKDENGKFTRKIGAFRPNYGAVYIQDKFAIEDFVFNLGIRVDRYDANQMVPKDPFTLVEARTVADVSSIGNVKVSHPTTANDDWVVYVDDENNPKEITGYRQPKKGDQDDRWYDSQGNLVQDVKFLNGGDPMIPYKKDLTNTNNEIRVSAFKDYEPQYTVMPRVSFSFPISEDAQFFAHYDILTQRPTDNFLTPYHYYFIESLINTYGDFENPNLKPQRTIDYQVGFKQKLNSVSSITLSAFYRDMKDMIQARILKGTFPMTQYTTYDNFDFGSVKGLSVDFDLRRIRNVRIRTSYTIQFANGTASTSSYGSSLAANGQSNLRTPIPLDFDQRHQIKLNIDYRFGSKENYNGPRLFGSKIFSNTGANFTIDAGSGTPYSQILYPMAEARVGENQKFTLKGNMNGSRKPWQFRTNMKIDKDVEFKMGKGENAKALVLNIYFQVSNLFNNLNIVSIYRYTGSPSDDGWLSSAEGLQDLNSQTNKEAYEALYRLKLNDPDNYSMPRRMNVGLSLNF